MRDLAALLSPRRIAVVGGGAWGEAVAGAAARIGFEGEIIPVHPAGKTIAGRTSVRSVTAIEDTVDAAFVCVNREASVDVVEALAQTGCRGAVCFASGFAEAAEEDASASALQARLVRAAGAMPILGPNCYGFINALDRACIWPDQHGMVPVERGVAILTQSSNIAINMSLQRRAVSIAMMITCGNMAQTRQVDLARHLVGDPRITAIGLHIEGFGDLRAWEAFAREAAERGLPVVALKVGASDVAQQAALSHTASLAGSDSGASALLERLGFARATSVTDFLETLKILHMAGPLAAPSMTSISCSGGEASLMADLAAAEGVHCPHLTKQQSVDLRNTLGPRVALANPLDYHTYIWRDVEAMGHAWTAAASGPASITLSVVDYPHTDARDWDCATEAAKVARAKSGKPFAVVASLPELMPKDVAVDLAAHDVIPMHGLHDALRAVRIAASVNAPETDVPLALPGAERNAVMLDEATAKNTLSAFGVHVPRQLTVTEACSEPGPFAVKGVGLAHKTEAGAVHINVAGSDVEQVARNIGTDTTLVEEMITDGLAELLIGVLRDPAHGFVLTLGAGGVMTEILNDTQSVLIPCPRETLRDRLALLKIAPVLNGYRGKPPANIDAILDAIESVQNYVLANLDSVEEVEINPVIATPTRAVAVDALIRKEA